jgi:hypothetical protein
MKKEVDTDYKVSTDGQADPASEGLVILARIIARSISGISTGCQSTPPNSDDIEADPSGSSSHNISPRR